MHTLLKGLLLSAPLAALLFYYVATKQQKLEVDIRRDETRFERDWNEFDERNGFGGGKTAKARAKEAEAELKLLAEEASRGKRRSDVFVEEFDKAVEEAAKEARQ